MGVDGGEVGGGEFRVDEGFAVFFQVLDFAGAVIVGFVGKGQDTGDAGGGDGRGGEDGEPAPDAGGLRIALDQRLVAQVEGEAHALALACRVIQCQSVQAGGGVFQTSQEPIRALLVGQSRRQFQRQGQAAADFGHASGGGASQRAAGEVGKEGASFGGVKRA